LDPNDPTHASCVDALTSHDGPLYLPTLCLAELSYFAGKRLGWSGELRFLAALESAELTLVPVEPSELARIGQLVTKYRDLPLGTTDASIVAAAERRDITTIATLDHGHFGVVRPAHAEAFELIP
jgi:uncharacterized protein